MHEIDGKAKTVHQLLNNEKYAIDYYQREYKWGQKQVQELVVDLTQNFLDDYEVGQERSAVENYGHYFLGSIITSNKNGKKFIIDGQQRLTTLTLLLIYLNNKQSDRTDKVLITEMIFSEKFGKKSFNLEVDERVPCMEALFNQQTMEVNGQPESVNNILLRYADIESMFPDEIEEEALPYFLDWLLENVHFVEITAYTDEDAYTIFETMNDRGLSLSPTDMLKGYLLANITDEKKRSEANELIRKLFQQLSENGQTEASDFFKAWFRSQYAESIRERKKSAKPGDFDRQGSEFHRWFRDYDKRLGLNYSDDYYKFVKTNLAFFGKQYYRIRKASIVINPLVEEIFYIAQTGFTLQYPVLLAPLTIDDSEEIIIKKIKMVASYIDILLARRIWNWHSISYSTLQYAMFLLMRDIRRRTLEELADILMSRLDEEKERFITNDRFSLHQMNRPYVHWLLARMTDYVQTKSGENSRILEYLGVAKGQKYEIEHIWANHPEWHTDEFTHPVDFQEYRNRIGGLLLLPKSFNASYGDLPYEGKLVQYFSQNLLARSLNAKCYEHHPRFVQFSQEEGLPFESFEHFMKADLEKRQTLYKLLAEMVWSPKRIEEI
jgi:uncharacterized protein with ParB-like and HNH nuclease domain